ncbi:MAG: hypothetical protein QOH30_2806 [Baekduia sp.]|jgi:alkylation response protein AidB-like acyl-CoA dehydrogenase|nr:Acyl-CoA dehydrogenase fadE12 [Conexibacter sp.]MDX6716248.1 hypothetical protein [Baekduia sp.]
MTRAHTEPTTYGLSPAHQRLLDDAHEVAASFAPQAREIRRHLIDEHEMHPALWTAFCARGWPALALGTPPGDGGGLLGLALVLEAFAEHNIVLWMPVLSSALAHAIAEVGPDPARDAWLGRVASGEAFLAMATTEAETGHNIFRSSTEIRAVDGDFVVSGIKRVTSGLDVAERVLVFGRAGAADDERRSGFTAVLVDPRAPGATMVELPMGHREGVRQFALELDAVTVPGDAIVGEPGQGLMAMWPFTQVERILTSALCVGSAGYAIARSVERASSRTISGTLPIGAAQAVAHPLAALHARLQAVRLFVRQTAARFDAGVDGFVIAGETNSAKALTADLAYDAADHAMQVMGADAWDEREGWLDVFLDARLSRSGPVSNEFALNFIAQHVLGLPAHR